MPRVCCCRYICVEERHKFVAKPPVAVTNAVSWRGEGIKHKKNEIFLDVIEKLNILVSANGTVLRSEILGSLKMKSFLSGMPELKLGLNDKVLMDSSGRADPTKGKSVDLEDIRFHQCVRLSRFENDRTISFIPPDGEFDLMVYRLNTQVRPLLWIEAHVEPHSHSRVEYMIKAKSNFKRRSTANNVEIVIPVPTDADSPAFKCSIGKVEYVPERSAIVWRIKQFQVRAQNAIGNDAGGGSPLRSYFGVFVQKPTLLMLTQSFLFPVSPAAVRLCVPCPALSCFSLF